MKIAINALSARVGSGPTFFNNFLPALMANDHHNEYCVILGEAQTRDLVELPERLEQRIIKHVPQNPIARVLWEQMVLPLYLRKWRIDLLYSTGNITSLLAACDTVVVFTNSNPFSPLQLDWSGLDKIKHLLLRQFSKLSAWKAEKVIFISENSRDLICRRLSMPAAKTDVIYYGWTPFQQSSANGFAHLDDYILFVSVLMPHKNIEKLMRAFDLLVERHKYPGTLAIVGSVVSEKYYRRLLEVAETLKHRKQIHFTGRVTNEELAAFYKHARLFVLPSVEETLGIPLQEAMGWGVPIATADCRLSQGNEACFNPFREICGPAADYFNPFDEASICDSMERLLSDADYRRRLAAMGKERVKQFTWDSTARATLAIFEQLGENGH